MKPAVAQPRRLRDVVFFQEGPGLRNWQWTHGGMKVINGTNILPDGSIDISNTDKYIAQSEFEGRYRHFAVDEGDIVLSSSGTLGKVGRITADHLPLMMNTSVIRFRTKDPSILDDGYLFAFMRSPQFQALIRTFAVGGVQQNFGPVHLKQIEMPVPALHQQQRIADILSAYDDLIENNRRRMALLEEAARQLYREWFVRLRFPDHEHTRITNGVPEGWEKKTLGHLCKEVGETIKPDALDPGTPYIGLEHMPRRSISLSDWGTAEQVTSTKHRFREGEFLFGKIRPYFHKVGIAFVDGITSADAIVIRPLESALCGFVLMTVSSDPFVAVTAQTMKEGSKMPRADWKQMQAYSVSLPTADLLGSFESAIQAIVEQLRTLTFMNRELREARDLLLPRLMSGEITV